LSDDPTTLGEATKTTAQMFVWCKACTHQNQTDAADVAEVFGAKMWLRAWRDRLICSQCGDIDDPARSPSSSPSSCSARAT